MAAQVRRISDGDIAGFRRVLDEVARERRYLSLVEAPPLADVERFVRGNIERGATQFVAVEGERVVGWCDVLPRREEGFGHTGRLGMGVAAEWRRRGIGRGLLSAALDDVRASGRLIRIELEVFSSNGGAIELYKSAGFTIDGVRRRARFLDGVWDDLVMMAVFIVQLGQV